jgi:hypothetical protein
MVFFFKVFVGLAARGETMTDVREHLVWRRRCGNNACVEVAFDRQHVLVRDSQDAAGPRLGFTTDAWKSFMRAVRHSKI